jgi:hypothetical protein
VSVIVVAALLAAAGCETRLGTTVTVDPAGSGSVAVAVDVDDGVLARLPGAVERLRLDDLVERGWQVEGPRRDGGWTRLVARRRFERPEQLGPLLAEVGGPSGPLASASLVVQRAPEVTRWRLTVSAGWDGDVRSFGDEAFFAALGGSLPVAGERATAAALRLRVEVRLPGSVRATGEGVAVSRDGLVVWEPPLGPSPVTMTAVGEQREPAVEQARRTVRTGLTVLAVWAVAVVALGVGWLVAGRVRRRGSGRGGDTTAVPDPATPLS